MKFASLPPARWWSTVDRRSTTADVAAGVTVAAMLVPQAMAYALLADLPPAVGLAAATLPLVAYALLGTSRQLAVGPVAIVSLMTASALAPIAAEHGPEAALGAAALLAVLVGVVHFALAAMRAGKLVARLSHGVLVGFTAAAALIIGASQGKHLLGVSIDRHDRVVDTLAALGSAIPGAHATTALLGVVALVVLTMLKRWAPRVPAALAVVAGSVIAVQLFGLEARGVRVVGDIPSTLPSFGLPALSGDFVAQLATAALLITLVGFMESFAVANVEARRHGYRVEPNQELVALGAANLTAGLFGGYPITGGFSRTAVNARAGARTPIASIVSAVMVLATIACSSRRCLASAFPPQRSARSSSALCSA